VADLVGEAVEQDARGASGLSSAFASGKNRRLGVEQTYTPPKPTSMPERLISLSAKTVRLSNRPSPSASSKIRIRSRRSWGSVSSACQSG
jgi:hypothetical protein